MTPHLGAPIERHIAIGDRRSAALVTEDGSIDWCCLPDFDGVPVFGALLDPEGGVCRLGPASGAAGRLAYLPDSAVSTLTWELDGCELELQDAMLLPRAGGFASSPVARWLVRRLACVSGRGVAALRVDPRAAFDGSIRMTELGSAGIEGAPSGPAIQVWTTIPAVTARLSRRQDAEFEMQSGDVFWLVLNWGGSEAQLSAELVQSELDYTVRSWKGWAVEHPLWGPHSQAVGRSVTTIRLLSHSAHGSQVAAPTTSLPERIGGDRNYDYRYAWIRDSSLALAIMAVLGDRAAARHYMDWLSGLGSESEMPLQVLYRIDGGCSIDEQELANVAGYRGSRPVRIGNHAVGQLQLDSLGYLADCALIYLDHGGEWKTRDWQLVERIADFTAQRWMAPDHGIWELDDVHQYVSSKVMAWTVLDRARRIAEKTGVGVPPHWHETQEAIHENVTQHGWNEARQAFVQHYDDDALDASVLLMCGMGFLPPDDQRLVSTVAAIERELMQQGFVWRFHPRSLGRPDLPLDGLEGAFLPCSFWLASTYARQGRQEDARALLQRVEDAFAPLGLLSEEYDPRTGTALGNHPLLFSHAEHIKAVMDLAHAEPLGMAAMAAGQMAGKVARALRHVTGRRAKCPPS